MAAKLAHDFNGILGLVVGRLSLLEGETGPGAQPQLEAARRATRLGQELVRKLMEVARPETGEPAACDLGELAAGFAGSLRESLPAEIRVQTRREGGACRALADAGAISRVLEQLCLNAREAMRGGGEITITTGAAEDGYARISVADDGCGIAEEDLERIFEPLFSTKKGRGVGLGLALAHGIVRKHGGFLEVRSAPGEGTAVHVYLPVSEAVSRGRAAFSGAAPRASLS